MVVSIGSEDNLAEQREIIDDILVGEKHFIGSSAYRKITLSLFAVGITIFASMYSTQALMPALSTYFHVLPAYSALSISLTTGAVSLAMIPAGVLSERFGRTRVMIWSAILTTIFGLILPFTPSMNLLLVGRAIQGLVLAGVPAVAMAYIAEEIHEESLGSAMGRYIAGNTVGGLAGRLFSSFSLDFFGWRGALFIVGLVALLCTAIFIKNIPDSRFFTPKNMSLRAELRHIYQHITTPALACLFILPFLWMGGFVSLYNYLSYRLEAKPFSLSPSLIGLIFIMYLAGTYSSAKSGKLSDRIGRQKVMITSLIVAIIGLVFTLSTWVPAIIFGVMLFTAGVFGAHPTASAWVGKIAVVNRGEASGIFLASYYMGSAILGGSSGVVYQHYHWSGVVAFISISLLLAIALSLILFQIIKHNERSISHSSCP